MNYPHDPVVARRPIYRTALIALLAGHTLLVGWVQAAGPALAPPMVVHESHPAGTEICDTAALAEGHKRFWYGHTDLVSGRDGRLNSELRATARLARGNLH
ncbi:MAG: hypothetical protein AAF517_14520, partial [Planctomycetota bacterium]